MDTDKQIGLAVQGKKDLPVSSQTQIISQTVAHREGNHSKFAVGLTSSKIYFIPAS